MTAFVNKKICFFNLKTHHPAEITKLCLLNDLVISPNATKYTTKLDKKDSIETEAAVW